MADGELNPSHDPFDAPRSRVTRAQQIKIVALLVLIAAAVSASVIAADYFSPHRAAPLTQAADFTKSSASAP